MVPEGTMPLVRLAGVVVNVAPLQIVAVSGLTDAVALTVTVTVNVVPTQLPEVGETI